MKPELISELTSNFILLIAIVYVGFLVLIFYAIWKHLKSPNSDTNSPKKLEEKYISKLTSLYYRLGDNAFKQKRLEKIQKKTGYSIAKIEEDLKRIRSQVRATQARLGNQAKITQGDYAIAKMQEMSRRDSRVGVTQSQKQPQKQPQSTSAPNTVQKVPIPVIPTAPQKTPIPSPKAPAPQNKDSQLSEYEYVLALRDLFLNLGTNAFKRYNLEKIQRQTGYSIGKIKADLKRLRNQIESKGDLKRVQLTKESEQSQGKPKQSTPSVAQKTSTEQQRIPVLVFAPYTIDYVITQLIDSDFCFEELIGVPDELKQELTKYTAMGTWIDEKDPLMRFMEVCNNDITFYKVLKAPASMLSFTITERENYQNLHFSMIFAATEQGKQRIFSQSAPMHQIDDADYRRMELSLLLRRQGVADKYNLGNFQDYVEQVKIALPLKTAPKAPTPPQSTPSPGTPQKAPTPPQNQSIPSSPSAPQKTPMPSPKAPTIQESPAPSNIYGYISSMPKDILIQSIRGEYYHIKGTFDTAPAMGEYGSFEFAGVLLIWKYLRENLRTNFREIGEFMIPLGAHIGCAYNCMTALEWSDILESIIKAHDLLPYDEFSQIYRYLKENFSNEIHAMEFCGEAVIPVERIYRYRAFVRDYNAFPDYSFTLSYFEKQGLRIKQDMPFRIDC